MTAALALGGTRQGEPRRDKQSGQGEAFSKEPGATPGGSWWPIDRRQQCHSSCQTASSDARGVGVTATSKPFTMPTIRMHQSTYSYVPEMRGQSPCPYAVQRFPKREASAACSSCEMLLASWQTCHGTEARRNWSTRRSAWQASKKKILGILAQLYPFSIPMMMDSMTSSAEFVFVFGGFLRACRFPMLPLFRSVAM